MPTPERLYANKSADERRAERRARLLEVALEGFGTDGYRGTSIEGLCAAAGISTRNFYEEFSSRERLLIELHDELNAKAHLAVVEAIAAVDPGDLELRARAGLAAYCEVMTGDRRAARIGLVETIGVSDETDAARQAAIDRFADLLTLEAERLRGEGLLPEREYRLAAVAAVGAVYALINTWRTDPQWDEHIDLVVDEATRAIVGILRGADRT